MTRLDKDCTVDGCTTKQTARGYCIKHYYRLRASGELKKRTKMPSICTAKDCGSSHFAAGYCSKHYHRLRRHGDLNRGRLSVNVGECKIVGCTRDSRTKGWCMMHYGRWTRHGDPLMTKKGSVYNVKDPQLSSKIAKIPLNNGRFAFIDIDDLPLVEEFNWICLNAQASINLAYAMTNERTDEIDHNGWKKFRTLYMHRAIMRDTHDIDGFYIDHRNGNGLDNRRENLRVVTPKINALNRRALNVRNTSGYHNVKKSKSGNWIATVKGFRNGKTRVLFSKTFPTREEAAQAYDLNVLRIYTSDVEPRSLNFPDKYDEYLKIISGSTP